MKHKVYTLSLLLFFVSAVSAQKPGNHVSVKKIILTSKYTSVNRSIEYDSSCLTEIKNLQQKKSSQSIITLRLINVENKLDRTVGIAIYVLDSKKKDCKYLGSIVAPKFEKSVYGNDTPVTYSLELNSFINDNHFGSFFDSKNLNLKLSILNFSASNLSGQFIIENIIVDCKAQ